MARPQYVGSVAGAVRIMETGFEPDPGTRFDLLTVYDVRPRSGVIWPEVWLGASLQLLGPITPRSPLG